MSRFFDIQPPRPKPAPRPEPRRPKRNSGLFLLIALIIIIIIFGLQLSNTKVASDAAPTPTSDGTNFELFDPAGQSNLTQEKTLTVRILNASGEEPPAETAKKLLTDAGVKIEQVGKSVNLYEQTIIYYKKDALSQGQKVEGVLKNSFQAKLQESDNLGTTYDVLVIVGQK